MGPLLFTSIQKADLSLPVGGIVASYSFLMKDAPKYRPGYTIIVSFLCVSIASIVGYYVAVTAENPTILKWCAVVIVSRFVSLRLAGSSGGTSPFHDYPPAETQSNATFLLTPHTLHVQGTVDDILKQP